MTDQTYTGTQADPVITLQDVDDVLGIFRRQMKPKAFQAALAAVREKADQQDSWRDSNVVPIRGRALRLSKAAALRALTDRMFR